MVSYYTEQLNNSEAVRNLRAAGEIMGGLEGTIWLDLRTRDLANRLNDVVSLALARLMATRGTVVSRHSLNVLGSRSETFLNEVERFRDDIQNPDHSRIDGSVESLLETIAEMPRLVEPASDEVVQAATIQLGRIEELARSIEEAHGSAGGMLTEIDEIRDKALDRIVQIDVSTIRDVYQRVGDQHLRVSRWWHWSGVGVLVLLVAVAGLSYSGWFGALAHQRESAAVAVMAGYGLPAAIVFLATVFLGRSRNYRRRGEDAARISDELVLFWDVADRLPEDQRKTLISEILPRYFAGAPTPSLGSYGLDGLDGATALMNRMRPNK